MNRYEQHIEREPKRPAWKSSKIGDALLHGWQITATYGSVRGWTVLQGYDGEGRAAA